MGKNGDIIQEKDNFPVARPKKKKRLQIKPTFLNVQYNAWTKAHYTYTFLWNLKILSYTEDFFNIFHWQQIDREGNVISAHYLALHW